jgi:hypothetical protein
MWPWNWNFDWQNAVGLIGGIITIVGTVGLWIREARRKIIFSAPRVYFGPSLNANNFMGRNYPSEDSITLDCDLRFFSNKSLPTGLHNFYLEFCRTTYMGRLVEFTPDPNYVMRDLEKTGVSHTFDTLDLPSRQWVSLQLTTWMDRKKWTVLKCCDFVRLSCETAEGRKKRFPIAGIRFPEMPPEGLRGPEYCSVQITQKDHHDERVVIKAVRRHQLSGMPGIMPLAEDMRYWSGSTWVESISDARVYSDRKQALDAGEKIKIWNIVPKGWQPVPEKKIKWSGKPGAEEESQTS